MNPSEEGERAGAGRVSGGEETGGGPEHRSLVPPKKKKRKKKTFKLSSAAHADTKKIININGSKMPKCLVWRL